MKDQAVIRDRYMRDPLSVRLGGLASNLARIKSFSDNPMHQHIVEDLINESKYFIEWTAPDAELDIQSELIELQLQLARWHNRWEVIWPDPVQRALMAQQVYMWSQKLLKLSWLLR